MGRRITEQIPDERIAWRSTDGETQPRQVTFRRADPHETEVTVQMRREPEGLKEKVGGALGPDERRIKGDLDRFEAVLDERGGRESGAWRGEQN